MDEKLDTIKRHIDAEREELGRNLDEIEYRVKNATDLKAQFNKNTGLILGVAAAGGFLLSLAFRNSSNSDSRQSGESGSTKESSANTLAPPTHRVSKQLHRFSETLDNIFDGLVGVASAKLQSFVADAVPGFQEQYDVIDRQRKSS
jgi:hypothetical protein